MHLYTRILSEQARQIDFFPKKEGMRLGCYGAHTLNSVVSYLCPCGGTLCPHSSFSLLPFVSVRGYGLLYNK